MEKPIKQCVFHMVDGKTIVTQGETAQQIYDAFLENSINPNGVLNFLDVAIFLRHVIKVEYIR